MNIVLFNPCIGSLPRINKSLFLLSTCTAELISTPKIMTFLPTLLSVYENCERISNAVATIFVFIWIIILTLLNRSKQSYRVKLVFKSCEHLSNSQENEFTTLFGLNVTLSCCKQLPLNSDLYSRIIHPYNFWRKLWFAVEGSLIFSFDNPLDSRSAIVSGRPENVLFEVTFLFNFSSLSSKSVFFTKLVISFLLAISAYANLEAKLFDVNLLNS